MVTQKSSRSSMIGLLKQRASSFNKLDSNLELENIPLEKIVLNKDQVRKSCDDTGLIELAESLKNEGQRVPVGVFKEGETYRLLYGHRRYEAAKLAEIEALDAVVYHKDFSEKDLIIVQLTENIQREDMSPLDIASSLEDLVKHGMTQVEIAERLGRSKGYISSIMALNYLPETLRTCLKNMRDLKDGSTIDLLRRAFQKDEEKALALLQAEITEDMTTISRKVAKRIHELVSEPQTESSNQEPVSNVSQDESESQTDTDTPAAEDPSPKKKAPKNLLKVGKLPEGCVKTPAADPTVLEVQVVYRAEDGTLTKPQTGYILPNLVPSEAGTCCVLMVSDQKVHLVKSANVVIRQTLRESEMITKLGLK